MQQQKQEKKKTSKRQHPAKYARYRTIAAAKLRNEADRWPKGSRRRADLLAKAKKIAAGTKRHHKPSKLRGPLAETKRRIENIGRGWNALAPYDKRKIQNPVAIVAMVRVGGDIHFDSIPVVGVAWDKRVGNEVNNAPKSGMYHIVIVDY